MSKLSNQAIRSATQATCDDTKVTLGATLVLLCKRPALHQGKQRLAATMGPERALNFAEHFLACALEDLSQWPGNIVIAPASADDVAWARLLLSKPASIIAQQAGNLGQRINRLDRQLRLSGHVNILYIGSDAPILTSHDFSQISEALTHHDIALAPAIDGGVTIMANRKPWPDLQSLPWSTEQLGAALAALCDKNRLGVTTTALSYDIDHEQQLPRLALDLSHDLRPARQALLKQIQLFTAH